MKKSTALATILLFICSCTVKEEQRPHSFRAQVVEARGYVVPKDSMAEPKVIPAGSPKIIPAGRPKSVLVDSNICPAGKPKIVMAGAPRICTPGKDGLSLPKTVTLVDSLVDTLVIVGSPEVVIATQSISREQNPQNFSSLGFLQGFKTHVIYCLLQDRHGNLWFGTQGGGATRYDGKSFSHFTEKQGLRSNFIRSILEDSNGDIWFGMGTSAGVTKYDGKTFTHFTERHGFGSSLVFSIVKDAKGNLWFATAKNGVSKYDGKSFVHFTKKQGLISDSVLSILQDKTGDLWFGTGGGVTRYDGQSFAHFTQKEGFSNSSVQSIAEDSSGNLWFATREDGVFKYDRRNFIHYTKKEGLTSNDVRCIRTDKGGNLWFGTWGSGVIKFDGKSFRHLSEKDGLINDFVYNILEDKHNNHWFVTEGGVSKYPPGSLIHFTKKEGLSGNKVVSIVEDRLGNLWFGTFQDGLNKFDGQSFKAFGSNEGLLNRNIWCLREDKDGNLWCGTEQGVIKYDGRNFNYYTEKEGLINDDVKCIYQDRAGCLWFGTQGGVSKFNGKQFTNFSKESLGMENVMAIIEDRRGIFWFGGYNEGVTKFDGNNVTNFTRRDGLSHDNVRLIEEDKHGQLWFGTVGGGVCKYDGKKFTTFNEGSGLITDRITSILEDKNGNIWFGTTLGLSKLGAEKLLSEHNAIPYPDRNPNKHPAQKYNKAIDHMRNDASDRRGSENFFKTYNDEDGLSGVGNGNAICEARNGTLWIGSSERLTAFRPSAEIVDTIPPNIQLTGITLFNENIPWQKLVSYQEGTGHAAAIKDTAIMLGNGVLVDEFRFGNVAKWYSLPEQLSLTYDNNYLTFQFVGITMRSPRKVRYQYKLEGLDQGWSALTDRTEAPYANLQHGKYTFKVRAVNGDGYWSKEFHYPFTIRPPWWQTWWAYTLAILIVAGVIYTVFRYRLQKIRKQHEIKQKTAKLEMQALRAQMNPHFIFNSLNSINLFILENNKLQASEYLSKFSRLIRLILNNSQELFIPLERELEALQLYLELEAVRFEQRFDYKITVEESVDTTLLKVPPLVIQPYAENAIWHGLMHKKDKGHLEIELYQQEGMLFCKISDDGVGRRRAAQYKNKSASTPKSLGMRITADRIALLQDGKQHNTCISVNDVILPDGSPGGTEVLLKIPVGYD